MGLKQYDKTLDVSETNVDRGYIVMDAIDEDDLDQLRQHMAETEGAMFRAAAAGGSSRPTEYRPAQDLFDDGDGSEADIFSAACK